MKFFQNLIVFENENFHVFFFCCCCVASLVGAYFVVLYVLYIWRYFINAKKYKIVGKRSDYMFKYQCSESVWTFRKMISKYYFIFSLQLTLYFECKFKWKLCGIEIDIRVVNILSSKNYCSKMWNSMKHSINSHKYLKKKGHRHEYEYESIWITADDRTNLGINKWFTHQILWFFECKKSHLMISNPYHPCPSQCFTNTYLL